MHVMDQGNINVSDLGLAMLVGIIVGLFSAAPLIWLSWKIPQQIFAADCLSARYARPDPAIYAFSWQDALFVGGVCASAVAVVALKGLDLKGFVAFYYCGMLLLLAKIDARTYMLPDVLTLSLLWAGLLWHAAEGSDLTLARSVWGAAAGYIVLWGPCALFGGWWGREVMGHGDFKLSAAIGAWLGCLSLPFVWLIASGSSILIVLIANRFCGRRLREPMPFGPGLALGGILMLFFDEQWSNF
jgi:prepilin signal peptidase PulO-like enzyme (type II secretory pathway)